MKLEPDQIERMRRAWEHPDAPVANDRRFFHQACALLLRRIQENGYRAELQYAEIGGVKHQFSVYAKETTWVDEVSRDHDIAKGRVWFNAVRVYLPVLEAELGLESNP